MYSENAGADGQEYYNSMRKLVNVPDRAGIICIYLL